MLQPGHTVIGAFVSAIVVLHVSAQAQGAERWAAVEGVAIAELPDPSRSASITRGTLACSEQRWSLVLTLAESVQGTDGARAAQLSIGSNQFDLEASRRGQEIAVAITSDVLPPLRSGVRMDVTVTGGETDLNARFSLIGSRRAIDEATPLCSKRDMSAYRAIVPGELNPETVLARELLDADIREFRAATRSVPAVAAAMVDAGDGKRLLFATICGSSWYYGNSGCNMTVHAQEGDAEWRRVYETEGVAMHIDPNAQSDGWPNLVALTFDGEEIAWRWMNGDYQMPITEELRGG